MRPASMLRSRLSQVLEDARTHATLPAAEGGPEGPAGPQRWLTQDVGRRAGAQWTRRHGLGSPCGPRPPGEPCSCWPPSTPPRLPRHLPQTSLTDRPLFSRCLGVAHMWPSGQSGDPGDPKGEWDPFCPGKMRPQHAASWHLCFGTDWSLTGVRSPQHAAPWAGCSVSAHSVGHVLARALGLFPTFLPTGTSGVPPPASAGTASSPWPPALALGSRLSTEQPGKASRVACVPWVGLLANEERQKHPAPACPPLTAVPREVAVWTLHPGQPRTRE